MCVCVYVLVCACIVRVCVCVWMCTCLVIISLQHVDESVSTQLKQEKHADKIAKLQKG